MSHKKGDTSIQTFLRVRPSKNPSGFFTVNEADRTSIRFKLPDNLKADYINNSALNYEFRFNGVLDMTTNQDKVFETVGKAAVNNALEGYNSTIFAYGQTGSGKTYTLTGGGDRYPDRGIIPRSISLLYQEFRARGPRQLQYKAYISYLEIYNEIGYDLLDPSTTKSNTKSLEDLSRVRLLKDDQGNFHLKGLSLHCAADEEEALNLLFLGDMNRTTAATAMNPDSSRSHCIFTISIEARDNSNSSVAIEGAGEGEGEDSKEAIVPAGGGGGGGKIRRSKLHLVDLAGSERVSKTSSSGQTFTEAGYINKSLFFLEMVIVALHEKAVKGSNGGRHIPYRNSLMTSVLRDSLGGNCKTIMVATINPEALQTEESLSTCRFAQRVALIKNSATINEEVDSAVVISKLSKTVLTLREEISYLKGEAGEGDRLGPTELEAIKESCRRYVDEGRGGGAGGAIAGGGGGGGTELELGSLTLNKIKAAFRCLRELVYEEGTRGGWAGGGNYKVAIAGGEGQGGEESSSSAPIIEKMKGQVQELKARLIDREAEINILVNMMRSGQQGLDQVRQLAASTASTASASAAAGSNGSSMMAASPSSQQPQLQQQPLTTACRPRTGQSQQLGQQGQSQSQVLPLSSSSSSIGAKAIATSSATSALAMTAQQQLQRDQRYYTKLLTRYLYSTPPPLHDLTLLDAHDTAKTYFYSTNPLLGQAHAENKTLIKGKMAEARACGERAQQSKNTIAYLKNSIEAIRREMTMEMMHRLNRRQEQGSEEGGAGAAAAKDIAESPEEVSYRRAIDQEKTIYYEALEKLKVLKPEIAYLKELIEKGEKKLAEQFDNWVEHLMQHPEIVELARRCQQGMGGGTGGAGGSSQQGEEEEGGDEEEASMTADDLYRRVRREEQAQTLPPPRVAESKAMPITMRSSNTMQQQQLQQQAGSSSSSNKASSSSSSSSNSSLMMVAEAKQQPQGQSQNQSSVEDDIAAFYQAKEELLKRRNSSSHNNNNSHSSNNS